MKAKSPGQSALLLLDVIQVLNKSKIPYAVIGAFAASFYGVVRASLDADVIIFFEDKTGIEQLCATFKKRKLRINYRRGDFNDPVRGVINIQDSFKNSVDLLTGIRGMSNDVFGRVKKARFMGRSIKVISKEDFIAMKIFAGSPKDIQDAIGVLDVSGEKINLSVLKKLTKGYGRAYVKTIEKIFRERL